MNSKSLQDKVANAVKNNIDINSFVTIDGQQLSQLMVACLHGNIDNVKALLKAPGVKVDLQNDEGWHALMYACREGHTEIAQLILNNIIAINYIKYQTRMDLLH